MLGTIDNNPQATLSYTRLFTQCSSLNPGVLT